MTLNALPAKHGAIFSQLLVLAVLSVASVFLPLSEAAHALVFLIIAFAMATLVVSQYMGLKGEGPLVVWVFFIPVILFVLLVALLLPDIAHFRVPFLGVR
jgi:hypothetical protein